MNIDHMHIYVYTHETQLHVYIYTHIYMHIYIYIHIYILYIYIYIYIFVYVHMYHAICHKSIKHGCFNHSSFSPLNQGWMGGSFNLQELLAGQLQLGDPRRLQLQGHQLGAWNGGLRLGVVLHYPLELLCLWENPRFWCNQQLGNSNHDCGGFEAIGGLASWRPHRYRTLPGGS